MYEYQKSESTGRWESTGRIIDRRELLRIKLKSLAAEAKIIRHEERRTFGSFRDEMHQHRVGVVREVARNTHIAYGLIKGKSYEQIEGNAQSTPDWDAIQKMVDRYGPAGMKLARNKGTAKLETKALAMQTN